MSNEEDEELRWGRSVSTAEKRAQTMRVKKLAKTLGAQLSVWKGLKGSEAHVTLDGEVMTASKAEEVLRARVAAQAAGRQHATKKKMTKAERLSVIKAARQASRDGDHQLAAVLFAMVGISYADGQPADNPPILHATKKKELEQSIPSVGHLAWLDGRTKEAYVHGGEVYIAPTSYPLDTEGRRQGARWESSLSHWKRYYETLWRARVVGGPRKRREYWIAPASDPRDRYAAGRDANSFTSKREAQAAIRSLRRLGGDFDVPWIVNEG